MGIIRHRISIVRIRKPRELTLNEELLWFGHSLGLIGERDRDKSCFRLFIELLKLAKLGRWVSSDELSQRLNLSRGTVIHHMNKLLECGLAVQQRQRYSLRDSNLEVLLDHLRRDFEKACLEIKKAAREIDIVLGA